MATRPRLVPALLAVMMMVNVLSAPWAQQSSHAAGAGASAGGAVQGPAPRAMGTVTPIISPTGADMYAVDWDPSTGTALLAGANGTVLSYNATSGFRQMQQDVNFSFSHIAFWPSNGSTLALLAGADLSTAPVDSSVLLAYNGTGFERIPTDAYAYITGVAWSPDASYALVAATKGWNGVILKYQGGSLTEVWNDTVRNYKALCWDGAGAYLASFNFDNQTTNSVDIQFFDGTRIASDLQVPGLNNLFARDISWSATLAIGLCTADDTNLLRFNSTAAAIVQDPSLRGDLNGVAWGHSRPLALVTGADMAQQEGTDGLLYSYNGSALTVESSGRYFGLNGAAWHPGDLYALVVGDNGTVLRFTVPNAPPLCAITYPRAPATVQGVVNVSGTAWDPDSDPIVFVQVNIDGGPWQTADGGSQWSYSWDTTALADGSHTITARANDGLDDSISPATSTVIVDNPDRPPAVSITGPSEGAAVQGSVSVTGGASDPDPGDSVTVVQVAIDNGQWANASGTSSWSYPWDSAPYQDGPHAIRARAFDGELYSAEAVRNVSLQNHGPDYPPTCTIGSPTSGTLVAGQVTVQGTASDPENKLVSVLVKIDSGGYQAASGTASWSFQWDTRPLPGGAHTVTARAFDGVQNSSDARVTVQVGHQPVCIITSPASGAVLTGEVTVQGTATDSDPGDAITSVKVRIDAGEWTAATGTASWSYRWNTSQTSAGQHVIRARCSDGALDSAEVSRSVTVEKPPSAVRLSEPTEMGEEYIILRWTVNTDPDFSRYEVFASLTEGAPLSGISPRGVPAQSVTVYNYTGLEPRTTYWFRVRVVDNSGQSSVSNEVFATTARANQPPIAMLAASRLRAPAGESISFSAEGSYDRDGRIVRYQWDFDGKGRFPLDTGPIAEQRHQFDRPGKYLVGVRITDDRGAANTTSLEVTIFDRQQGGFPAEALFGAAVVAILVMGAAAYLYMRRPPTQQSYYEHDVHRPAVERRRELWPGEEEQGPASRPVRKRRA